jgi:hypothetical protein
MSSNYPLLVKFVQTRESRHASLAYDPYTETTHDESGNDNSPVRLDECITSTHSQITAVRNDPTSDEATDR